MLQRAIRYLRLRHALRNVSCGPGVVIYGDPSNLSIASGVLLQAHVVVHAGGLKWSHGTGRVAIGPGSVISPGAVLYGAGPGGLEIGRDFDCGPMVGIFASRSDYRRGGHIFAPVKIGDGVTVFAGAVISPGVTIGDRAVVAANAVVTTDVPPGAFVAGVPAKAIR